MSNDIACLDIKKQKISCDANLTQIKKVKTEIKDIETKLDKFNSDELYESQKKYNTLTSQSESFKLSLNETNQQEQIRKQLDSKIEEK